MVANEGEADDPDGLKNPRLDEREAFRRVTFEEWRDERTLEYDGAYDDKRSEERR